MAVSKKSLTKPAVHKSTVAKALRSSNSPATTSTKMVTAMRMAKAAQAKLARPASF
jgi:hypothetical protein